MTPILSAYQTWKLTHKATGEHHTYDLLLFLEQFNNSDVYQLLEEAVELKYRIDGLKK